MAPAQPAASGVTQRRVGEQQQKQSAMISPYGKVPTTPSPYAGYTSDTSYASTASSTYEYTIANHNNVLKSQPSNKPAKGMKQDASPYQHNVMIAAFWIPCLWIVVQNYESSTPMTAVLCVSLALYALDMANMRQALLFGLWLSAVIMVFVTGWFTLIEDEEGDSQGSGALVLFYLVQIAIHSMLFVCGACWMTLQLEWLAPSTVKSLEESLHSLLPMVFSAICGVRLSMMVEADFGRDTAGILSPYIFAILMAISMLTIGCAAPRTSMESLYKSGPGRPSVNKNGEKKDLPSNTASTLLVSNSTAFFHIAILLLTPIAMHLATCLGRIISSYSSMDDLYDIVLVAAFPYLLQYFITWLHESKLRLSPYATPKLGSSLHLWGVLRPMFVSLVASLAVQQRYMIALSHAFSYSFMGSKMPAWLISIYMTGATISMIFTMSVWGRVSPKTNQPLFGEYHEDVIQIGLSLTGMLLGKGVGLPWNFTPLPVLAFLGLSLWFTTRMLRYLSIFLFVIHATGVVVFTYRFAGIDQLVSLPVFGLRLPIIRFGLVVVSCSILIGLVAGFAVRSNGGYASTLAKRFDFAGLFFILYTLLLAALEIALLKRPVPNSELVGVLADEVETDDMLYDPAWAFVTSAIIVIISSFMQRVKIISGKTFGAVISLAIGKSVAIYIDTFNVEGVTTEETSPGSLAFWRTLVTALLCLMMCYPRFVLKPVHVKTSAIYRRSLANASGNTQLPPGASRTAMIYIFFILPLSLLISVQFVLIPFAHAIRSDFHGSSFYSVNPPVSEVIGFALALWGIASLSMLNYYLPDGGAEVWKKLAAFVFLIGVGIFFAAPTLGFSVEASFNPYASISSGGTQVVNHVKGRTGSWGIVSAGVATLLAISGPLELKERRTDSVRRDKFLLFRTMIFSIMFGGGVAWFIIMQSMSEAPWLVLLLTGLSCLAISFLGTISAVLGYFIELEDMQEVEQVFMIWLAAVPVFLPVTGLPQFLQMESSHAFGTGGWLSTYLVICSSSAFCFALALRSRRMKNSMTRGLANLGVIISWVCAVAILYGRYGVAGMDENYDVTTVFGIPASIAGTLVISILLLALEGEQGGNGRTKRVTSQPQRTAKSSFGITFDSLIAGNSWVPMITGTSVVLIVASFYAVFLRGAGFLSFLGTGNVARSHKDVFAGVFGERKDHDLASLAEKAMSHVTALATSAKLASAGFWTAESIAGPIFHLIGILAVLPSLYLLVSQGWTGQLQTSTSLLMLSLPLNAIPIFISRGIPSLQAAAFLGLAGGLIQMVLVKQKSQASKMRI